MRTEWDFTLLNEEQKKEAREATINFQYDTLKDIYLKNKLADVRLGSCCWEAYIYGWFKHALDYECI